MPRKPRAYPKGRQLDPTAADAVAGVLADHPRQPEYLIEYLHLLQDRFAGLTKPHLHALAGELNLAPADVFAVASFYDRLKIVTDKDPMPADATIRVCRGLACELAGAEKLFSHLIDNIMSTNLRIVECACMGRCADAPAVSLAKNVIAPADPERLAIAVAKSEKDPLIPPYKPLATYQSNGGYQLLAQCRNGTLTADTVIEALTEAGLRGLGGAGFPAGRKWQIVRGFPGPRFVTVNADEGEPGTFKDRYWLETDPHRAIEGALIAATSVEAERVYVYLRDEYPHIHQILTCEIAALETAGLIEPGFIELRRGAGAYICGEESAMLESIEGRRGLPRQRPPYIAESGLFGRPTLNHNVETLSWVPEILARGAKWFAEQGRPDHPGLRSFSVSGRVRDPGVKIAPAGITLCELIDDHCGGMADGHRLKAFLPGGASGGIFPARMADLPLDFGTFEAHGGFIGSHGIIVLSDHDDVRSAALNLIRFFRDESCGQCTPCRVGSEKMAELIEAGNWDKALLQDLAKVMRDASICGLGQAAPNPVMSVLNYFAEETDDTAGPS